MGILLFRKVHGLQRKSVRLKYTIFWMQEYQEIDTIPVKVAQLQKVGYLPVASFVLPEKCWTEHYYQPLIGAVN